MFSTKTTTALSLPVYFTYHHFEHLLLTGAQTTGAQTTGSHSAAISLFFVTIL